MRAIVRHSIRKPAARGVATAALALLAATVPVSAATAAGPGHATTEAAPGRTVLTTATTSFAETGEVVRDIVDLLSPLGHTWGN
ncbi:hypothetical protein [Streptomyces sp. NPDC059166]|uniref:hypothetical protein n=1 Tax=Streptomyces sp. NPDC059166 TaxID=3346752 RepID=UPI0036C68FD6